MPPAARARVSLLSRFGSRWTIRIWLSRESSRTTLAAGSIGKAVRSGPPAGRSSSVMTCPLRSPPAKTRRSFGWGRALRGSSPCAATMPTRGSIRPTPTASFSTVRRAGCGSGTLRRRGVLLIPGCAAEESVGDPLDVKRRLWRRGRPSRQQPGPAAVRLLHDARHVLDEEKPRSRERVRVTPDALHIPRSIAVALDHAGARVAPALALRPVPWERDEGSVEIHELLGIGRAGAETPRSVGRQGRQELHAADTAELVAVGVHLRHTNRKRLAEPRRLQRDDAVRPSRPVVDTVGLVREPRPGRPRNRRSSHPIDRDERARIEPRVRARRRLAPVAH